MKNLLPLSFFFFALSFLNAQVDQPSVGAGYGDFTYYRLADGELSSSAHDTWDIAFSAGEMAVGVFVNEGVGLSFTTSLPQVELYLTSSSDFSAVDTAGMTRILNDEVSWAEGAFNHVKDIVNPADNGWGDYDFTTHQVNGTRVFVVRLRNEVFKKLEIQSLISGVYTFRYADLDGANEVTQTIDKADHSNKTLAYFSIENEEAVAVEPAQWDLLFSRYSTPLDDGAGGTIDYIVTGVLSNAGTLVGQADNIDPLSVEHTDFQGEYTDSLAVIGHDWKSFQMGWTVDPARAYFVKTTENEIWKIAFYDFEGSSTGVTTLEKTLEGMTSSLSENDYKELSTFDVFPNPVIESTNIVFEINTATPTGQLQIFNSLGQIVTNQSIQIQKGLNVKTISVDNYPTGLYHVSLKVGAELITRPFAKQ
jgi:hypothetical protein